ncbi:1-acyl-sn-glycerol-3-phosphate acyltransferase [Marinobacter bryozoorum]|uniref:lysophospholipid acyltransferase family protein n=1 Tax=Marinobacter bryozoorum TaxID=256324 RepID=UPI002004CB84|nr:1-acyl-sn-glycerol-3-phosphate acyltransferase [Marinobacter bryozoorum]MCK7543078.1 1-acyl-sn-glycerol-3-phosphate acyltransferase [Marinobacter bryozoorum]
MQEFDAIRPYGDDEVEGAVKRLSNDPDFLLMVGRFRSPFLARWFPGLLRKRVKSWLWKQFGSARTVRDIQLRVADHVTELVNHTTSRLTSSGLDRLDPTSSYLFICNHRDIVFDPMVINHLLHLHGFDTTRIAIGDNLLKNPVFAEMMRLNKSFVVQRDIQSPREMRQVFLTLSGFINHSLDDGHSIWIAQREGRAKDGVDLTDPAIIKMFYMSRKKEGLGFAEAMDRMRIVPVSIAYEYDPCDADKARELETRERTGSYTKAENEDSEQIVKGLTGFKGHVHVHFGLPIEDAPDNAKDLAAHIDGEIHANYHLHASNLVAYNMRGMHPSAHDTPENVSEEVVTAESWTPAELEAASKELERRINACDEAIRPYLVAMYANPVISSLTALNAQQTHQTEPER